MSVLFVVGLIGINDNVLYFWGLAERNTTQCFMGPNDHTACHVRKESCLHYEL